MTEDRLIDALLVGIDVSSRVNSNPEFPRKIKDIQELVQGEATDSRGVPYSISLDAKVYQARRILGKVEIKNSSASIIYDIDRTTCWRRFIITKELAHLLFWEADQQAFTDEEVTNLINKISTGLDLMADDHAIGSEAWAILMALEILLPHSERAKIEELLASGKTEDYIARLYKIPLQKLRFYLSSGYSSLMDGAYSIAGK